MSRFLVTHGIESMYTSQDEWVEDWKGLRSRTNGEGGARWLRSWYSAQSNRLYCEWESEEEGAIRSCFTEEELTRAPILSVDEVVFMDPVWLDEG